MSTKEIVELHAETVRAYEEEAKLTPLSLLATVSLMAMFVWGFVVFVMLLFAPSPGSERYEWFNGFIPPPSAYHR